MTNSFLGRTFLGFIILCAAVAIFGVGAYVLHNSLLARHILGFLLIAVLAFFIAALIGTVFDDSDDYS